MDKELVVKKFDALASKYGVDRRDVLSMFDISNEMEVVRRTFFLIQDARLQHSAQKDFESEEGNLTAYGQVVVNCVHLMQLSLEYFDSETTVLEWQHSGPDILLRKISLAYEAYWHFNGDFLLRSAMNDALEYGATPFSRNTRTFRHPNVDPVYHQQVVSVVSEIVSLYFDYDGFLPKKHKPPLKPWLLATETPTQDWKLPSTKNTLTLDNMGVRQLIRGSSFSIELCYKGASLAQGDNVEIRGGTVTVVDQGKLIYSGDHSFTIDLDRNNGYTAVIDYWQAGRCRWLPVILKQQQKMTGAIAAHLEQIEVLMQEACDNLLQLAMSTRLEVRSKIHEHLYHLELTRHNFCDYLFRQLQHEYLNSNLCANAVSKNYRCIQFLPGRELENLRIGLEALTYARSEIIGDVWGHIFCHTHIQLDDLAKAYIKDNSDCYTSLPLRLKTEEIRRYTVETHPNCLNYTMDTTVFANQEEFEIFLELEKTGLAETVLTIMNISGFTPRKAYERARETASLTVEAKALPTLGGTVTY